MSHQSQFVSARCQSDKDDSFFVNCGLEMILLHYYLYSFLVFTVGGKPTVLNQIVHKG